MHIILLQQDKEGLMALKKEFLMVSPSVITKTNTVTGNVGHEVLLSLKGSLDLHLSLREGRMCERYETVKWRDPCSVL